MFLIEVKYAVSAKYTPDFEQWYKNNVNYLIDTVSYSLQI